MPSFYRRPLPEGLVPFSSDAGRALFAEALADGTLEGWFPVAESFRTQADPAFCGLGSLVVALNALAIDPGRTWKGVWRWYSEELLDCCKPLHRVQQDGVTLDELACLARCNGASARLLRPADTDLSHFREDLARVSRAKGGEVLIASYSRAALGQTGDGHFSPVGGFHAGRDLALLMDVATFKYPPHWVPVESLWAALHPPDPATEKSRGYLLLRPSERAMRLAFRLSLDAASVAEAISTLRESLTALPAGPTAPALQALAARIPPSLWPTLRPVEDEAARLREIVLAEIAATPLYQAIDAARIPTPTEHGAALLWALIQVALPLVPDAPPALRALADSPLPPALSDELDGLREQTRQLVRQACCA